MGDPKYPRKVWRKPKRPLNYELKMEELKTLGTFGLRTKRELWKAHTELSRVRHQARSLLALRQEVRAEKEPILMKSLARIGLVSRDATLDDVLNLNATDLLSRRLQTIVTKKLGFKTPYQARQAVIHGHIMIGERKVNIPSYTVTVDEEESVHFAPESKIPQMLEKTKKDEPVTDTAEGAAEDATETTEGADTASPDTASPDTASPDTASPDTASPDTASPDTASPDTASPDTASPDTASPDTASPDTASPDTASPDTASPDTASPDTASPDTASPDTASPDTASPDTTDATKDAEKTTDTAEAPKEKGSE